jgi:hypothetical protein
MPLSRELASIWALPFLVFLGACGVKPECDTFAARDAVLKAVSNDRNNSLAKYAEKSATVADHGDANPEPAKSKKPIYELGNKIVTESTGRDKRTLSCSGSMSVTVGDAKATKRSTSQSSNRRTEGFPFPSNHSNFDVVAQDIGKGSW